MYPIYTVPTRNLIFAAFATAYYAILVYAYVHPAPYRHEEKKHEAIVATIRFLMQPKHLRPQFPLSDLERYRGDPELFLKDYPKCCSASMFYRGISPSNFHKGSSISKVSTTLGTYFNMEDYGTSINFNTPDFTFRGWTEVSAHGNILNYGIQIKDK